MTDAELEAALRKRAFARDADLVLTPLPDGRFRAAFVRAFTDAIARQAGQPDITVIAAEAMDKRKALEALISADGMRPPGI